MAKREVSMAELVAAHNEAAEKLGEKTVQRFKDRATAEARTKALLKRLKAKPVGKIGRPIKTVDYPFTGELKDVPEGTITEQFRDALKRGATRADLEKILEKEGGEGNLSNRVTNRLRGLHNRYGYGIKQNGDVLKLVTR